MKYFSTLTLLFLIATLRGAEPAAIAPDNRPSVATKPEPLYEFKEVHDRDGIGKFYMGREIAHVMGHQAADWLERSEREEEEQTSKLVEMLHVKSGEIVADIGAGTGYLARRLAPRVSPGGRVLGVDIQPEMLEILTSKSKAAGITNISPVLGTLTNPNLPAASIDLIVMVDVYHEFSHPYEMTEAMCRGLKVGGRIAFVEFRKEDPGVPIKLLHKMSDAQVRKEMSMHPLEWVETRSDLPWQHLIVFKKK